MGISSKVWAVAGLMLVVFVGTAWAQEEVADTGRHNFRYDTDQQLPGLPPVEDEIFTMAFNHDGSWLAAATNDRLFYRWQFPSLKPSEPFRTVSPLSCFTWIPGTAAVAIGLRDSVEIFAANKVTPFKVVPTVRRVTAITFDPKARMMAVALSDLSVAIFDTMTEKEIHRLTGAQREISSLRFTRDGRRLFATGGNYMEATQTREGPNNSKRTVLTYETRGEVCQWNLDNGDLVSRQEIPQGSLNAAVSPNGEYIAVLYDDRYPGSQTKREPFVYSNRLLAIWQVPAAGTEFSETTHKLRLVGDTATGAATGRIAPAWSSDSALVSVGNEWWVLDEEVKTARRILQEAEGGNGASAFTPSGSHKASVRGKQIVILKQVQEPPK